MSTPPSWFLKEMNVFLHLRTVEAAVLKSRPELAGSVHEPEPGRPVLTFDVEHDQRVVVGLIERGASGRSWMIADSRRDSEPALLPRQTASELLAQAVVDRVDSVSARQDSGNAP